MEWNNINILKLDKNGGRIEYSNTGKVDMVCEQ